MPILKYRRRTIRSLSQLVPEINYVMCGARGEHTSRLMRALPQVRFFGFEADLEEVARLRDTRQPGFTYFPTAVGGTSELRTLYVTRHPACSSLLAPDAQLLRPYLTAPRLDLVELVPVNVVSLDDYLPGAGVSHIDFLDLDTQGSSWRSCRAGKNCSRAGRRWSSAR